MAALKDVDLYHSADDTAYADVMIEGHRETYPVKSRQFQNYLRRQYFLITKSAPGAEALSTVIGTAEAQAAYSPYQHEVYIRVANVGDRVFLDLGDATHRVVEITENGWDILDVPPNDVRFRRPRGMKALPEPKKSNLDAVTRLEPLYRLMNLKDKDEFVLTVAWILAALHGKGPFPVASITAEQGSAKSTRARLMRSTFDAHAVLLRSPFREMREGHIAMKNTYVVAVDNLSSLPQWLSDMHCCASTGGGSTYRSLYTDEDETFFDLKRPQILNGIEDVAIRADLADRSIFFAPKPISDEDRLTEEELWADFNAVHADLLGALLDVLSHGLSRRHVIKPKNLPRMADFTTLMMACETALWPEGTFRAAYDLNLAEVTATVLSADLVASAVRDLMQDRSRWEGTATALLQVLRGVAGEQATKAPNWPRNGFALSTRLRRGASNLRKIGVAIEFGHDGTKQRSRRIVITAPGEPTQAANGRTVPNGAAAEPKKSEHGGRGGRGGRQYRPL